MQLQRPVRKFRNDDLRRPIRVVPEKVANFSRVKRCSCVSSQVNSAQNDDPACVEECVLEMLF